jgi:hypothetical protein
VTRFGPKQKKYKMLSTFILLICTVFCTHTVVFTGKNLKCLTNCNPSLESLSCHQKESKWICKDDRIVSYKVECLQDNCVVEYGLKSRNRGIKSFFDPVHPKEHQKRIDKLREWNSDDHDNFVNLLYFIWITIAIVILMVVFSPYLELNRRDVVAEKIK